MGMYVYMCMYVCVCVADWVVVVVEWLRSRPLDCEVRGSNPGQGRNLKTKISALGAPW